MRRLLLCLLCLGLSFTSICEAETPSPVRLHVVADSNEPEAQRLKLLVRDRVALETRALLTSARGKTDTTGASRFGRDKCP
ncbi:MAG: stage II sporulation protein R, partial [Clostridia bacterium]|nr:stage II sporulation protein R [Clostridia bacterium]